MRATEKNRGFFTALVHFWAPNKSFITGCQPGSLNCGKHICGGNEYWLPFASYWGCCKGKIHDLRESYCTENLADLLCSAPIASPFKCRNGHCIPTDWLCNKVNDCQDGSDELDCDLCNGTNNFRCWNGRCVPQSAVCDAYNDCGDGSDETFCRTLAGGWCTAKQYGCATDVCIPVEAVCDGKADCTDKSDEIGCNKSEKITFLAFFWEFQLNRRYESWTFVVALVVLLV